MKTTVSVLACLLICVGWSTRRAPGRPVPLWRQAATASIEASRPATPPLIATGAGVEFAALSADDAPDIAAQGPAGVE
ncbi:MAG: hypothetical protein AAFX76_13815 [Planctomycetota bacterium]